MHEGTLAVHQIKLVIDARENLCNRGRIRDHTASTHDFSEIATGNNGWGLVGDAALEACGTPVHELNGPLGLDGGNRCIHILWNHVTTVHHATCHVLAVAGSHFTNIDAGSKTLIVISATDNCSW